MIVCSLDQSPTPKFRIFATAAPDKDFMGQNNRSEVPGNAIVFRSKPQKIQQ